ncbi:MULTISPECIES: CurL C-terminal domain-containing protein [unclassified Streptomyces]|uniref:CurL C-terminal domain-containing protein n=1 Tax=unclassified Streptomyces TaxID=2593676 RepID=UPI004042D95A
MTTTDTRAPVAGATARAAVFPVPPGAPRVLAVSARDEQAAAVVCERLADRLERDPTLVLDDVAVTLAHGRERFAARHAVTGTDPLGLAAALRASARRAHPAGPAGTLVLDLGDGSVPDGDPDLPQVAEALGLADDLDLPAGGDQAAARTAAVLHGIGAWLAAHGVRPDAIRGRGPAAAAAAALRGSLALPDALRAAAAHAVPPAADVPAEPDLVIRLGARSGTEGTAATGHELYLDALEPASYAGLFAALWEHGADVDCSLGAPGRRVRLPGYPFQRSGSVATPPPGLRPLTPHEQRWLFHDLVRRGDAVEHTLCATAVLPGPVPERAAAEAALERLLRRRPVLRTVFTRHTGRWFAAASRRPVPVDILPRDERGEPAARARAATIDATFAAADVPLVRCALAPADGHWAVALAVYAPVAGSSSAGDLLDELTDELLIEWPAPPDSDAPRPTAASA